MAAVLSGSRSATSRRAGRGSNTPMWNQRVPLCTRLKVRDSSLVIFSHKGGRILGVWGSCEPNLSRDTLCTTTPPVLKFGTIIVFSTAGPSFELHSGLPNKGCVFPWPLGVAQPAQMRCIAKMSMGLVKCLSL